MNMMCHYKNAYVKGYYEKAVEFFKTFLWSNI